MIYVDRQRCDGCGLCLESCPEGAISLMDDGFAFITEALCKHCEACLKVCPQGAIIVAELVEAPEPVAVPVRAPAGEVMRPLPETGRWLAPALGSTLVLVGRALLPRLIRSAASLLGRSAQRQASSLVTRPTRLSWPQVARRAQPRVGRNRSPGASGRRQLGRRGRRQRRRMRSRPR